MLVSLAPMGFALDGESGEDPVVVAETLDNDQPDPAADPTADPNGDPEPGEEPGEQPDAVEEGVEPAEPVEEEENEDEDAPAALTLVRFVSQRELTLQLSDEQGPVEPVSAEALAAYLAEQQALGRELAFPAEDAELYAFTANYLLSPGVYAYSAQAEGCETLMGEVTVNEQTLWGETVELALVENALPYGFKGMGEGYVLSEAELAYKQALADHGVAGLAQTLTPGVDYVADQVMFLAESEDYAAQVAEAYCAQLVSFDYGVAVLRLTEATPVQAVTAGADMSLPLPAVELNQLSSPEPDWGDSRMPGSGMKASAIEPVNTRADWEQWYNNAKYFGNPDPLLSDPTDWNYQYMHDIVNTYAAWGVTQGQGVKVAVIDSGVASHEDLVFTPVQAGSVAHSVEGDHGTHVAGIIAARENNGKGGAGIAPRASLISIRTDLSDAHVATAVQKAAEAGAKVINLSLGGYGYNYTLEKKLRDVIQQTGVTVVVSMGNENTNAKSYPAAYDIPGLIAVGSVTEARTRSAFSNTGAWMDVSAPGSAIKSTVPGNGYNFMSGTSMAAPVVSGVCALYLSQNPGASPQQVEAAIKAATTNGIVDASKLFISDKDAPSFFLDKTTSNGNAVYGSSLYISGAKAGEDIVYTINGKNPVVKDGMVIEGSVYTGPIPLNTSEGFTPGKKITVKAFRVTGLGLVSKTASLSFTLDYASPYGVTIVDPPHRIIAGKSVTLSAKVFPFDAADQKAVTWKVMSAPQGVSIDPKSGVLKTSAKSDGNIWVRVTSTINTSKYADCNITVGPPLLVKKLMLNYTKIDFPTTGDYEHLTPTALGAANNPISGVNFSYSSSNTKVATVDPFGMVTAVGKGKATITVKAEGSNVTAKCAVEVKQWVSWIDIQGLRYVAPGKSASYKAAVWPSDANNKKLTWSVAGNPYGITMTPGGKLSVPKTAPTNISINIFATAQDGSSVQNSYTVYIRDLAPRVVLYDRGGSFYGGGIDYDKNGMLKQITMYPVELDSWVGDPKGWDDAHIDLGADTGPQSIPVTWTSSNTKVAIVGSDGRVWAQGPGTATITAKANDASGKKASVTVKVINPASGVTVTSSALTSSDGWKLLAVGKSAKNTATISAAFGKPTITKVRWDWGLQIWDDNGNDLADSNHELYDAFYDWILYKKLVSVNGSGTLSTKAALADLLTAYDNYEFVVNVIATTTDSTYLSDGVSYRLVRPVSKISLEQSATVSATLNTAGMPNDRVNYYILSHYGSSWDYSNAEMSDFVVKSSNPNVAGGVLEMDSDGDYYVMVRSGAKGGTATITVTTADGTGKSATIKVKVLAPVG